MRINTRQISMFLIASLPILSMYRSPLPYFDLGLFSMIIVLFVHIFGTVRNRFNSRGLIVDREVKIWIIYITCLVVSLFFSGSAFSTCLLIVIKNIICVLLLILLYGYKLIDYNLLAKYYMKICDLSVYFILLQYLIYYGFGKLIFGYIEPMMMVAPNDHYIMGTARYFRAASLFREPSVYFSFIFVGIVIAMFDKKKNIKRAVLYTMGVICSTSGMGIAVTFALWVVFLFTNIIHNKNNAKYAFLIMLWVIAVYMFCSSPIGINILERVFNKSYKGGNAISGRLGGYYTLGDLRGLHFLFGNGYGSHTFYYRSDSVNTYYPSWAFILYGIGVVGLIVTMIIFARLWIRSYKKVSRMLLLSIVMLGFVHTIFNGSNILFLMPFVYGLNSEEYG